jgi:hypothetical protein
MKDVYASLQRRSRLARLTRRAFCAWQQACAVYQDRATALRPSAYCIEEASRKADHLLRRYEILENALAQEAGLPKSSVYNQMATSWPVVPALMTNL